MISFGVPNFYCYVLQFNLFTTATLGRINVWTVPLPPPPQKKKVALVERCPFVEVRP